MACFSASGLKETMIKNNYPTLALEEAVEL
jgi:hypothetical protein